MSQFEPSADPTASPVRADADAPDDAVRQARDGGPVAPADSRLGAEDGAPLDGRAEDAAPLDGGAEDAAPLDGGAEDAAPPQGGTEDAALLDSSDDATRRAAGEAAAVAATGGADEAPHPAPGHTDAAHQNDRGPSGEVDPHGAAVHAALAELDELAERDLAQHPDVYDRIHRELQSALGAIDDA